MAVLFPYYMDVVDLWLSPFQKCMMDVAAAVPCPMTIHAVAMAVVMLLCLANSSTTLMMLLMFEV